MWSQRWGPSRLGLVALDLSLRLSIPAPSPFLPLSSMYAPRKGHMRIEQESNCLPARRSPLARSLISQAPISGTSQPSEPWEVDFGRLSQLIYGALLWWPDQTVTCTVVAPCRLCPPEQVQVFEPVLNTVTRDINIFWSCHCDHVCLFLEPCYVSLQDEF